MWRGRCWSIQLCPVHFSKKLTEDTITSKCWQTVVYHRRSVIFSCPLSFRQFLHSHLLALGCTVISSALSSSSLWAAVFSATSGCKDGLTLGIFSDANCFRRSSVVQSPFGNQLLAVKYHVIAFLGLVSWSWLLQGGFDRIEMQWKSNWMISQSGCLLWLFVESLRKWQILIVLSFKCTNLQEMCRDAASLSQVVSRGHPLFTPL